MLHQPPLSALTPQILAIETSSERLSLAILQGDSTYVREIDVGQRHSELAIAALADLLAEAKLTLADIDVIAFGQGPGSFVGVRIACGLAQGLALGADKPLIAVPTQLALAEQARRDYPNLSRVLIAVDARMGEFYVAAFEADAVGAKDAAADAADAMGWRTVVAPMLAKADQLPHLSGHDWHAIGSGFDVPALGAQLTARYAGQLINILSNRLPSAVDVARIATRQWAAQQNIPGAAIGMSAEFAAPLYLRNHVAMTIAERLTAKELKLTAMPGAAA